MAERVLSTRALNRALLARQLLLERSRLPLVRAIERVGGLQTQYAPSGYIALWSRLHGFRREALTRALEQRRVIQGWVMRATIHMVSRRDYPLLTAAVRSGRRRYWVRAQSGPLKGVDMNEVAARLRHHLSGGPRRHRELVSLMEAEGCPRFAVVAAGVWVDLVRVPPSGTWEQRRADLIALADDWVGPSSDTEAEGFEHLVRRYLGAFGPAPMNDIASWAGLPVTTLRPVVGRLRLRRFRDDHGGELLDLPRAPLPDARTRAPVRFIPTWDAILMTHARRTQILPEEYRALVFNTKTPHSLNTFLVDGQVAGSWRYENGKVTPAPFERLPVRVRREVEAEATGLAAFHVDWGPDPSSLSSAVSRLRRV